MVNKGMKDGDIFEDGGTYVVDKVLPDGNYLSHRVEEEPKKRGRKPKEE